MMTQKKCRVKAKDHRFFTQNGRRFKITIFGLKMVVLIFFSKFVYNCVFRNRGKNNTHESFHILKMKAHILKMKAHFEKETHFGNESSF